MIAYVRGVIAEKSSDMVVIDVNGIGYGVNVPSTIISKLPAIGEIATLHTYLYIREDMACLYGFDSKDSLDIFKLLITVNGIGPKGALSVLSTLTPDELRFAVLSDDSKTIAKSPGIGQKTAVKAILELKDKLDLETSFNIKSEHEGANNTNGSDQINEAVMALIALGYSNSQAIKAIRSCDISDNMESDEILKLALKAIVKLGF